MKQFVTDHKSKVTFVVAILAALYSYYVEQIPGVDPEVWGAVLGISGTYAVVKSKKKLGIGNALSTVKNLNTLRKGFNDTANEDQQEGK